MTHYPSKSDFLLDPNIVFLNHGSFGACPRAVFEVYQTWQRRLECQPVLLLGREMTELDRQARQALGAYLHTSSDNLVFVPNATHGVNIIARSLALCPGDEVLTSNHEYGACDATWQFTCGKNGAAYVHQPIRLPAVSADELLEQFWQGVNARTRVIYLSHITSPTALRLPVEAICARAREAGILTVIDGAHAPGQIQLDLEAVGADWYVGNCHKWMLSPKGAGFLYARPGVQNLVEPLIVSWGYQGVQAGSGPLPGSSRFLDYLTWTGTRDPAAALSVPAAIEFLQAHDWQQVRMDCHLLLRETIQRICALVAMDPLMPLDPHWISQMGIAPLPAHTDLVTLKARLYADHRVEIPLIDWQGRKFVRISVQCYNTQQDLDALCDGLEVLLPQCTAKEPI